MALPKKILAISIEMIGIIIFMIVKLLANIEFAMEMIKVRIMIKPKRSP